MSAVVPFEALRSNVDSVRFEGGRRVDVSFFITSFAPGHGPGPHYHPYPEVFIVREGQATFTIGGEREVVHGGNVVIVDAGTPHAFRNSGDAPLHVISIHPSAEIVQIDVQSDR